jgi:hypothetical protein
MHQRITPGHNLTIPALSPFHGLVSRDYPCEDHVEICHHRSPFCLDETMIERIRFIVATPETKFIIAKKLQMKYHTDPLPPKACS